MFLRIVLALSFVFPVHAYELTVGSDYWNIHEGPARYLPNYSLPKDFKSSSQWIGLKAHAKPITPIGPVTLTVQANYNELTGHRVDRLDADYLMTDNIGARVGILPYRITLCQGWMADPDAYCRFHGLREVTQGSFGTQLYSTGYFQGWVLDGMVGIYRPLIDGQDKKLGPFVEVGPTVKHEKHGVSLNGTQTSTGIQARAAWLRTHQDQDSSAGSYQRQMRYDMAYAAIELPVYDYTIRFSLNTNEGNQVNPRFPYRWEGSSKTIEVINQLTSTDTLSIGVSQYQNRTIYQTEPNKQFVKVPSVSIQWDHEFGKGWNSTIQATRSIDDATTRAGVQTIRHGSALGIRVAKVFK